MRFGGGRDIQDEHNAASFSLKVLLVDFAGEMEAYSRANFRKHDGAARFERAFGGDATDRQDFRRWDINHVHAADFATAGRARATRSEMRGTAL